MVAPREGAWIEIMMRRRLIARCLVAPREGAWIEITSRSLSWTSSTVAPREGAWIEMHEVDDRHCPQCGRAP